MAHSHHYTHNPNQAGYDLLKFCANARRELYSRLVKPAVTDEKAFENFILEKVKIQKMDHQELRVALAS